MEQEIFFCNFGWKDYGVGSLENIMDMVKVMQFAVSQGKVAVHCHAGLGVSTYSFRSYTCVSYKVQNVYIVLFNNAVTSIVSTVCIRPDWRVDCNVLALH